MEGLLFDYLGFQLGNAFLVLVTFSSRRVGSTLIIIQPFHHPSFSFASGFNVEKMSYRR